MEYTFDLDDVKILHYDTSKRGFSIPVNNGVFVLHKPTGIYVEEHSDRSVHVNKIKALEKLDELLKAQQRR